MTSVIEGKENSCNQALDSASSSPSAHEDSIFECRSSTGVVTEGIEHVALCVYEGDNPPIIGSRNSVSTRAETRSRVVCSASTISRRALRADVVVEYCLIKGFRRGNARFSAFRLAARLTCTIPGLEAIAVWVYSKRRFHKSDNVD